MNHPITTESASEKTDLLPDDDPFYRGKNWQVIQKRIADWDNPNALKIAKTMEELEAMANDQSSGRFVESPRPVGQPSSRPVAPQTP